MRLPVAAALSLLILATIIPLAAAQPPFQTGDMSTQLTVVYPKLETYVLSQNATMHFHVFNIEGLPVNNDTVDCFFHVYDETDNHIYQQEMVFDVTEWEADLNASLLSRIGEYPYTAFCYNASIGGFVSGEFLVSTDGVTETTPFSWLLLAFLPFLFSFLLVFGARLFEPTEHWVLHVGAYLLALVNTFVGSWFATLAVIKFTEWSEMQEALGTWTWVSGVMIAVLVVYWMIYIFYTLVNIAAQKKERRLEQ